jgi:peptide deformylase
MRPILFLFMIGILCLHAEEQNSKTAVETFLKDPLSSIRTTGDPILQSPTRKLSVDEIQNDPSVREAVTLGHLALSEFRAKKGFGRAIAAPQIGYSISMICLFLHGQRMTIFNPEIIYKSPETFLMWDDCLSFPDQMACVRRHKSISVAFMDDKGAGRTWINLPKDLAELLQHEIDHLNGVLALDIAENPPAAQQACSGSNGTGEDEMCAVARVVPRAVYEEQQDKFDSYVREGRGGGGIIN